MSSLSQVAWWAKPEKNNKVSLDKKGDIVSVLTIAMVLVLSIQIARFHSQSRKKASLQDKNTCGGALPENWRGANMQEGAYGQDSMVIIYSSIINFKVVLEIYKLILHQLTLFFLYSCMPDKGPPVRGSGCHHCHLDHWHSAAKLASDIHYLCS